MSSRPRVARAGQTCWRREPADRVALLRNPDAFYHELARSLLRAHRRVWILAWDFDRRVRLTRGRASDRLPPTRLDELLLDCLDRRPELELRVLVWDKAVAFAHGVDELAHQDPLRLEHPRAIVRLDRAHPPLSSPHQKIVVIDDALAFSGGIDLTQARWDTAAHRARDRRRRQVDGASYRPYHDVQMLVDGPAAAALAELVARRWRAATGESLRALEPAAGSSIDLWPEGLDPDLREVEVCIARTEPAYEGRPPVREVERLYLASIARAERSIFIEQQYFTDALVCEALCQRLREPEGPELILILPRDTTGWLARLTMETLLPDRLRRLERADRHGRLRVLYPDGPGIPDEEGSSINVHAKLMIVDDRSIRVGSANLNRKSMRYDAECDLMIDVGEDAAGRVAIRRFRRRVLAEHLDCPVAEVARRERSAGTLCEAIDGLRRDCPGRLRPLEPGLPDWWIGLLARLPWPSAVRRHPTREAGSPSWRWLLLPLALLALAAAWRWGPLAESIDPATLAGWLAGRAWAGPALFALYLIGSQLMLPVHLLHVVALLGLGPRLGMLWAIAGTLAAALLSYAIGRALGKPFLHRHLGSRALSLSQRAGASGLRGALLLRLMPGLPFGMANMVFGASHVGFGAFLVATALVMLPTPILIALLGEGAARAWLEPSPANLLLLGALLALALLAGWGLERLRRRWRDAADAS